jgi:probable selenate reductase FAD-binding subunit
MTEVSYFAPTDISQALHLLAESGSKAAVLAGGTDLMPQINYYTRKPEVIIFIGNLGLDYIKAQDGGLAIGAGTSIAKIIASELVAKHAPCLVTAGRQHSSVAIRTSATIGGNIANASPAADMVPPLMVMDATVVLKGIKGERSIPIADFFTGPGESVMAPGELIAEIKIPAAKGQCAFHKLGKRKAQACSVVTAGARIALKDGICEDARIVLGSMAPTPLRCKKAEAMLIGKRLDADLIQRCAIAAVGESSPIDDQRATACYRRDAGTALVARALQQAAGN